MPKNVLSWALVLVTGACAAVAVGCSGADGDGKTTESHDEALSAVDAGDGGGANPADNPAIDDPSLDESSPGQPSPWDHLEHTSSATSTRGLR